MDFRLVRDEFFGLRGPASTMVEVSSLSHPDYLIEIEAVAVLWASISGGVARYAALPTRRLVTASATQVVKLTAHLR
jgi:hypothetical protein